MIWRFCGTVLMGNETVFESSSLLSENLAVGSFSPSAKVCRELDGFDTTLVFCLHVRFAIYG
jgi:hypothetical protein